MSALVRIIPLAAVLIRFSSITVATGLWLSHFFAMNDGFWIGLQTPGPPQRKTAKPATMGK